MHVGTHRNLQVLALLCGGASTDKWANCSFFKAKDPAATNSVTESSSKSKDGRGGGEEAGAQVRLVCKHALM